MTNELESETEGYDAEVIRRVWSLAQVVPGNDPEVWRKDEFGAWIHRREYRNRHSEFGWGDRRLRLLPPRDGPRRAAPMQWQNHLDFMVATRNQAVMTADGLRNARRLL